MLKLVEVNEQNWLDVRQLSVGTNQENFLDSAVGILARGYVDEDAPDCLNLMHHFSKEQK